MTALGIELAGLTGQEAHALETHLRYAGDESYAAHGGTGTVRELDGLARYVRGARVRVLSSGSAPKVPDTRIDSEEMAHESVFGALTSAERRALAVHLIHGWAESRSAGVSQDTIDDVQREAYLADYAATAEFTTSGLAKGRTARSLPVSITVGTP